MKYFFCVPLVFCFLFSCSSTTKSNDEVLPAGLMDTATFVLVLADMHLVDAGSKFQMFPDNRKNAQKYSQYLGVLKNYNVTKAQWDTTMNYYSSRPDKFDHLYNDVLEVLSDKQAKMKEFADSTIQ